MDVECIVRKSSAVTCWNGNDMSRLLMERMKHTFWETHLEMKTHSAVELSKQKYNKHSDIIAFFLFSSMDIKVP